MTGHLDEAALLAARPTEALGRFRTISVGVAFVGLAALAFGWTVSSREAFLQSYLVGYLFWVCISVGSLGLLMVQHLSGGAWGIVTRRIFEAAARTVPLLAVLFLPIAFNLPVLFPWARPEAANDPLIAGKALYLNVTFFYVRAAIYFASWIILTFFLTRWSREQDEEPTRLPGPKDRRLRVLSGPGLVIYMITITFMSFDWIMSLVPHFYSTIFGILMVGWQGLSTMAFVIVILTLVSRYKPMSDVAGPNQFHDLGKLLLAFVMLWGYFNISQLLIIWSANLPEEIPWYLLRLNGEWRPIAWIVLLGHFALPFFILLSRDVKRHSRLLVRLAVFVLVMRFVDMVWTIGPIFRPNGPLVPWLDVAATVGLGGVWLIVFFTMLAGRSLVPAHDPYFKEAMAHGGH